MKNSTKVISALIELELKQFVKHNPTVKFRYSCVEADGLHLIEVSPSFKSFEVLMDNFDERLSRLVASNDITQSLVIFPEDDLDFSIEKCNLEVKGALYANDGWELLSSVSFGIFLQGIDKELNFENGELRLEQLEHGTLYSAQCTDKDSGLCDFKNGDTSFSLAA